jgi:hypothetical protein
MTVLQSGRDAALSAAVKAVDDLKSPWVALPSTEAEKEAGKTFFREFDAARDDIRDWLHAQLEE